MVITYDMIDMILIKNQQANTDNSKATVGAQCTVTSPDHDQFTATGNMYVHRIAGSLVIILQIYPRIT